MQVIDKSLRGSRTMTIIDVDLKFNELNGFASVKKKYHRENGYVLLSVSQLDHC